jgi:hypothetical protein
MPGRLRIAQHEVPGVCNQRIQSREGRLNVRQLLSSFSKHPNRDSAHQKNDRPSYCIPIENM